MGIVATRDEPSGALVEAWTDAQQSLSLPGRGRSLVLGRRGAGCDGRVREREGYRDAMTLDEFRRCIFDSTPDDWHAMPCEGERGSWYLDSFGAVSSYHDDVG